MNFVKLASVPIFQVDGTTREFQKIIVDWKEDGGFAQKGSIQGVSSALNCSPVVS